MRHRLPDLLAGLTDQQRIELELIGRHPAGARFARLLGEHLRGAPELIDYLAANTRGPGKPGAERTAEHRARKRAESSTKE